MSIPPLFVCPISLDLFTDPVTLSTGQTYDRPAIERWLSSGNLTCPVTMQRLRDASLVPNTTLRALIDNWLLSTAPHESPQSPDDTNSSLPLFKHNLASIETSINTKLDTLKKLRESPTEHKRSVERELVRLLLSDEITLATEALECVVSLLSSPSIMGHLNMLKELPNQERLFDLMVRGDARVKRGLCRLLESIASSPDARALCAMIARAQKPIVEELVTLLRHEEREVSDAAAASVCALARAVETNNHARARLVECGAVEGLVRYASRARVDGGGCVRALGAVEVLMGEEGAGERAMGAVGELVGMVFRVAEHEGSEHAVGALAEVCRGSEKAREKAVEAGVVGRLLLLMQSQCGSTGKAKAKALLKLLRCMGNVQG
ncbi:U-box domain-containing protein 26 [Acorus gramineus]|uniref:U-box domain-containing protein n=1 Tax=Acorus gramineus TaxID=55184 RepID=A0AAV9BI44_ACOGR|nr:U-box domain-containing protein 26 [Acorus gramineus]